MVAKFVVLLVACLAAAALSLFGLDRHAVAPSIVALSQIDGDAGVAGKSTVDQFGDTESVRALGAGLKSYRVVWTTGVELRLPRDNAQEQRAGTLFLTTVADPSKRDGNGEDNPYRQPQHHVEVELWIPPHATTSPVVLRTRSGPRSLQVRLTGGNIPSMVVSGLPAGTVSSQFVSSGAEGVRLISLTNGCLGGAQPERSTTIATFESGATTSSKLPSSRYLVCNGRSRYVGP